MVLDVRPEVKIPVLWVLSQEMSAFYSVFKQNQKIQCRKPDLYQTAGCQNSRVVMILFHQQRGCASYSDTWLSSFTLTW